MAEVLEEFDFLRYRNFPPSKYPWDQWLDGQIWRIEQGEDFNLDLPNMRSTIHDRAKRRGLRIRCTSTGTSLIFQAYKDEIEDVGSPDARD